MTGFDHAKGSHQIVLTLYLQLFKWFRWKINMLILDLSTIQSIS